MKTLLEYCVFLFCFAFLDGLNFRCDYRYTHLGWFKYHEIPATWHDARLRCKFEGGILASPTTAEMKSFMLESFCKHKIFTGIHATISKGDFYSINGIPLDQIPHEWAPYEPNNKNNAENCLALNSDGKFSDVKCDETLPYICYREHSNVDVNVCGTPDPEYHYESRTNKCYKLHKTPRQFNQAYLACSAEGGHLAIINGEDESKAIRDLFAMYPASKMSGKFYKDVASIGFHSWGESTDWITIHGQTIEEAGFSKFSGGHSHNDPTKEHCGSVYRNGLLNDNNGCEDYVAFICEKSPDYPAVCDITGATNKTTCGDVTIVDQPEIDVRRS